MSIFSSYSLPILLLVIVGFGLIKKVNVFSAFCDGATDALRVSLKILPSLIALLVAVTMFRSSGALDFLISLLSPVFSFLGIPNEIIPLSLLRPVSGSGSLALITDLLENYPPDSMIGRMASVIMGSTETTFYTIAVYFGAVGIKNIRHTLKAALLADLTGIIVGCAVCRFFWA